MRTRGFTLVEVLVALAILCVAALGGLQLVATAVRAVGVARVQHMTATLAASRLEQLRNLRFQYDDLGGRLTDATTNLAGETPSGDGGGLARSVPGSLDSNVSGFVDYLDGMGRWAGQGEMPPPDAVYVRRWSIEPSGLTADLVVLQVLVSPVASDGAAKSAVAQGRTRLVTMLARTHP